MKNRFSAKVVLLTLIAGVILGYSAKWFIGPRNPWVLLAHLIESGKELAIVERRHTESQYVYTAFINAVDNEHIGHANVFFVSNDPDLRNKTGLYGYSHQGAYTLEDVRLKRSVPGVLEREELGRFDKLTNHYQVLVRMDRGEYEKALALRDKWEASPGMYVIEDHDCVTFVMAIAECIGLEVPPRMTTSNTPKLYLKSLFLRNGVHPQSPK